MVGEIDEIQNGTEMVGTPMYCAPEQTRFLKRTVDGRADLYSLGISIFKMITGKVPFVGDVNEIIQHQVMTPAPDLRDLNPNVSPGLAAITKKLLLKDPDDRYLSAESLIHDLKNIDQINKKIQNSQDPQLGRQQVKNVSAKVGFVERIKETKELLEIWNNVESGDRGLAVVNGASGSGKSRLCSEFVNQIRRKNVLVINAKCTLLDKATPLSAMRQGLEFLVDDIFASAEGDRAEFVRRIASAAEGTGTSLESFCRRIKRVLKTNENSEQQKTDIDGQRIQFINNVSNFFVKLSTQWNSVLFLIDDLQWIDQSSLEIIQAILNHGDCSKFMILGTARNDSESAAAMDHLNNTLGEGLVEEIALSPFTKDQMGMLVASYLGTDKVNEELTNAVVSRSQGNPLLILELLRSGIEQGCIIYQGAKWVFYNEKWNRLQLSENALSLITKRIDGGSGDAKKFIQYVAFFGSPFVPMEMYEAVFGTETNDKVLPIEQIINECRSLGLIEPLGSNRWQISHDKITEAAIELCHDGDKEAFSVALAKFYYKKEDKSEMEMHIIARLLRSVECSKGDPLAIETNITSGTLSFENFSHAEAHTALKFALDLCREVDQEQLVSISRKLVVSATYVHDWATAHFCSELLIKNAKNSEELAEHYSTKVWMMKNKLDLTPAIEYFQLAAAEMGVYYPKYLHMKLLSFTFYLVKFVFSELIWGINPFSSLKKIVTASRTPSQKSNGTEEKQVFLFLNSIFCFQVAGKTIEFLLFSLRMLAIGYKTKDMKIKAKAFASGAYAFGQFGIRELTEGLANRSIALATQLNDEATLAWCRSYRLSALSVCGVIEKPKDEFDIYHDSFRRWLDPLDYARVFHLVKSTLSQHNGQAKESFDDYVQMLHDVDTKVVKIPDINLGLTLQVLIVNSEVLYPGHSDLSSWIERYESMSYKYRKNPIYFQAKLRKLINVRNLNDVDSGTLELLNAFQQSKGSADYVNMQLRSILTYTNLHFYQNSTERYEKYSHRHNFLREMRVIGRGLIHPNLTGMYFFLMGSFHRSNKKYEKAERCFKIAEKAAVKVDNWRVLYEVARDRARMYKELNMPNEMRAALFNASYLIGKNEWKAIGPILTREFENEFYEMGRFQFSGNAAANLDRASVTGSSKGGATHQGKGGATHQGKGGATHQGKANRTFQGKGNKTFQDGAKQKRGADSIANKTVVASELDQFAQQRLIEALVSVGTTSSGSLDPATQSRAVLTQLIKLFGAERGFIFLTDDANAHDLNLAAGLNLRGEDLGKVNSYSKTIVKKVVEKGEALIIGSVDEAEALGSESAVFYGLRSIIAAPLTIEKRLIGVAYLDSSLTKGLFRPVDRGLFSMVANNISIVFELARIARVELEKLSLQKELDIQVAITAESAKVKLLVDNMKQSLFSVDKKGSIVEPVSKFSTEIFGKEIVNQNIFEVLYDDTKKNQEAYDSIKNTYEIVFGEDSMQWELAEGGLPTRVKYGANNSTETEHQDRTLKVVNAPVFDDSGNLEKILYVVEDVTQLDALEARVKSAKAEADLLEDIMANEYKVLADFLKSCDDIIVSSGQILTDSTAEKSADISKEVMRRLHTLKGTARMYNLRSLSLQIHESETAVLQVSRDDFSVWRQTLLKELENVQVSKMKYQSILDKLSTAMGVSGKDSSGYHPLAMNGFVQEVGSLSDVLPKERYSRIQYALKRLNFKSVKDSVKKFDGMVRDLSKNFGKPVNFQVDGEALVDSSIWESIQECLLHILRNSIDHGLEALPDRSKAGKKDEGSITVDCSERGNRVLVVVRDDGKGIDGNKIGEIAVKKGLLTSEAVKAMPLDEKVNLIFAAGFSSKEEVSETSGRGVGLDVVKSNVSKLGGNLTLKTEIGVGTTFELEFPQALGVSEVDTEQTIVKKAG